MFKITDMDHLDSIVADFTSSVENIWAKYSKIVNIMVHSKSLWNVNCSRNLNKYRTFKHLEDWKQFKKTVKNTKSTFFDLKIQEISNP